MATLAPSVARASRVGDAETAELVVAQARRFAARLDAAAIDRAARIPREVVAEAAEIGLFGLTIPEEHGGLGLSLGDACRAIAAIAEHDRSVATTIGLHAGLGTRGLIELGSARAKASLLPELATGARIASFCATEAGAGSDLTAVRTTVRLDGDEVVLEGEKAYVTNGGIAGLFTVLARSPGLGGARAWSLVCVPRSAPGVAIGPEEHKLGIRGSSTTTVRFDGVRLPASALLGTPGAGMQHAHRILEHGRTLMAAGCIGTARTALARAVDHVTTRLQFGRRLGDLAPVQAHVATIASELWAMEAVVSHVGALEDRGAPIAIASSAAKVLCSDGAWDACDRAVQLHGALGFVEDAGVALLLRDCRVTRIFEGANDVLRVRVGTALASSAPGTERRVHTRARDIAASVTRAWDEADARLDAALAEGRRARGVMLVRDPLLLGHLADAHVALLAASASIARADGRSDDDRARAEHAATFHVARAERALDLAPVAAAQTTRDGALSEMVYRTRGEIA